jgi:hypothetical protein
MEALLILGLVIGTIYLGYLMTKGGGSGRDGPGDHDDSGSGG